jgi:uncharacterized protein involved in outer membrane biogenesis
MVKKVLKWTLLVVVLAVVFVGVVLPMLMNTEKGRTELAEVLGKAIHREVTLGDLDIGFFFSSVDAKDLVIMNPPGFPAGPFLRAGKLGFDAKLKRLLSGEVVGEATGSGLDVHVIRKGGKTNLEGIGGRKEGEAPKPPKEGEPPEPAPEPEAKRGPDLDLSRNCSTAG